MSPPRFSPNVENELRRSGWHAGRTADREVAAWSATLDPALGYAMFPAARAALLEFGGLRFEDEGAGEECARMAFITDLTHSASDADLFRDILRDEGVRLYPFAYIDRFDSYFGIDEQGRVFDTFERTTLYGPTVDEALERFIRGVEDPRFGPSGQILSCRVRKCPRYLLSKPAPAFCTECGQRLL